ncbi:MAG: helicase C-terminal domain-containing protein [Cyanobacteria bacterium P01_F01_bin.42]
MIEAQVHQQLYAFLKQQGSEHWPHHLTIARLVARALRLNRDAVLQISPMAEYQGRYRLSYLAALLLAPQSAVLVAPESTQQRLLRSDIPRFLQWSGVSKPVYQARDWPQRLGLVLISPQDWLLDSQLAQPQYPQDWPLIIDQATDLEHWAREALTVSLTFQSWEQLLWAYPEQRDLIQDLKAALMQKIFQHPSNPYGAIAINSDKRLLFERIHTELGYQAPERSPVQWHKFWTGLKAKGNHSWIEVNRDQGSFSAHTAPTTLSSRIAKLLTPRPTVLIGSGFGVETDAARYRQGLGMGEATYVQFAAERQTEDIQLYLPDRIPMPNTKEFQGALLTHLHQLLTQPDWTYLEQPMIVVVDDMPLKTQVAAHLAATLGSRVMMESTELQPNGVLVTGWKFWLANHLKISRPAGLLIATLPIPSPENPRVAARIEQYKRQRLDWFRLYLLPTAVRTLQQAIAPIREQNGWAAIFDNRILYRSYGQQILEALSPYARIASPEFYPAKELKNSA